MHKQSIQSLLVLKRTTGAIIRSSGSIAVRANENLVNEYAGMVWRFVKSAEELVKGMDSEVGAWTLRRVRFKLTTSWIGYAEAIEVEDKGP